jgi:hypothetical protein
MSRPGSLERAGGLDRGRYTRMLLLALKVS